MGVVETRSYNHSRVIRVIDNPEAYSLTKEVVEEVTGGEKINNIEQRDAVIEILMSERLSNESTIRPVFNLVVKEEHISKLSSIVEIF